MRVNRFAVQTGHKDITFKTRICVADVRRLCPTYAFLAYRQKCNEVGSGDDDKFYKELASAMATSPNVLRSSYIVSGHALAPGQVAGAKALGSAVTDAASLAPRGRRGRLSGSTPSESVLEMVRDIERKQEELQRLLNQ